MLRSASILRSASLFSRNHHIASPYKFVAQHLKDTPDRVKIKAVHFHVEGTLVDRYCIAPTQALSETFQSVGVTLTDRQISDHIDKSKIEHIRLILEEVKESWHATYGRYPTEKDCQYLYSTFEALLDIIINNNTDIIPHALEMLNFLRDQSILIGFTSDYSKPDVEAALNKLSERFTPDAITTADEVPDGPHIALVQKNNNKLGINEIDKVVYMSHASRNISNVYNTKHRPWIFGSPTHSIHIGFTYPDQVFHCDENQLRKKIQHVAKLLTHSGAHTNIIDYRSFPLAFLAAQKHLIEGTAPWYVNYLTMPPEINLTLSPTTEERQRTIALI